MSGKTVWIEMAQRPSGADVAQLGPHQAETRSGALMAVARMLVAAGVADGPWQAGRSGRVCLYGPSLHRLAALTCSEGATPPRLVPWKPMTTLTPACKSENTTRVSIMKRVRAVNERLFITWGRKIQR